MSLEGFIEGYVEAALWSEMDEEDRPLDDLYDESNLSPGTRALVERECRAFYEANMALWADEPDYEDNHAGQDFLLTRNRHGAGFWDRGIANGNALTEAAHAAGETHFYSEGGVVYQHGAIEPRSYERRERGVWNRHHRITIFENVEGRDRIPLAIVFDGEYGFFRHEVSADEMDQAQVARFFASFPDLRKPASVMRGVIVSIVDEGVSRRTFRRWADTGVTSGRTPPGTTDLSEHARRLFRALADSLGEQGPRE